MKLARFQSLFLYVVLGGTICSAAAAYPVVDAQVAGSHSIVRDLADIDLAVVYQYQIEVNHTAEFPNVEAGIEELREASLAELQDALEEAEEVAVQEITSTQETCTSQTSDSCANVESTVRVTLPEDRDAAYVKQATIELVYDFIDQFNQDHAGEIYVNFLGPFYVSTDITIEISPVDGKMDENEQDVFENTLRIFLGDALDQSPDDPTLVITGATVLFQILSNITSTTRRRLQGAPRRNAVTSFVSGQCNRCRNSFPKLVNDAVDADLDGFRNALIDNGMDTADPETDYFDGITDTRIIAAAEVPPEPREPGEDPDDKKSPYWIWITLGIAVVVLCGGLVVVLAKSGRSELKENEEGFDAACAVVDKEPEEEEKEEYHADPPEVQAQQQEDEQQQQGEVSSENKHHPQPQKEDEDEAWIYPYASANK